MGSVASRKGPQLTTEQYHHYEDGTFERFDTEQFWSYISVADNEIVRSGALLAGRQSDETHVWYPAFGTMKGHTPGPSGTSYGGAAKNWKAVYERSSSRSRPPIPEITGPSPQKEGMLLSPGDATNVHQVKPRIEKQKARRLKSRDGTLTSSGKVVRSTMRHRSSCLEKIAGCDCFRRTPSGVSETSEGFPRQESESSDEEDSEGATAVVVMAKNQPNESASNFTRPSSGSKKPSDAIPRIDRRKLIPEKPNYSLNLWSIMKNCVGKDLSKIPMPVNFNEPLSFLQRLTEDFEYSDCLDNAARCDQWEQMVHLAGFTISSYSPTTTRTGKPFNPLLGETFECDRRDDLGWRSITEQVSHHPPTCAMLAEGNSGWTLEQEFTMSSKFRGKYLQIIPLGIAHCRFSPSGNHYTWRKVTTTVHNIIVGRLWVDNHGEMDIVNHKTGDNCHLKFSAYSYFSKDVARKVTGVVTDRVGTARWVLRGTWDDHIEAAKVINTINSGSSKPVFETGEYKTVWKRRFPPAHLEKMYNFTQLAVEMNELEDGVAPTDSRRRPDQRHMEEGDWDAANKEKQRLEEKQRAARRLRDKEAEIAAAEGKAYPGYQPMWFKKTNDPTTGNPIHRFTGEYWTAKDNKQFEQCPDIF